MTSNCDTCNCHCDKCDPCHTESILRDSIYFKRIVINHHTKNDNILKILKQKLIEAEIKLEKYLKSEEYK